VRVVAAIDAALADWRAWTARRPGYADPEGTGLPSRAAIPDAPSEDDQTKDDSDFGSLLAVLGHLLWQPIAAHLGDLSVRLVPDGTLAAVPFAVLDRTRRPDGLRLLPAPALRGYGETK